jgi:hypothetical protein
LVFRIALDNPEDAARFFGQYSELLELKHTDRKELYRRPNFFQFQTEAGGVFLHCAATTCLIVENAARETFENINRAAALPAAPSPTAADAKPPQSITSLQPPRELGFSNSRISERQNFADPVAAALNR